MGKWLVGLAWPAISRILTALGLGTVTFVGMDAMLQNAISQSQSSFAGLAPEVLAILSISGCISAIGIFAGALTACLMLAVLKRFSFGSGT